ncbi:hypothetical protein CEXT_527041 [Caerostris extrusa]|uniref:Uncharacterized protein n=1 Tax=Caerostris extrusa TaxID=172846 RepID=A0AAV4T350_CAEEX|nr:hypothetical protein CEXT_527041 [Caerostris extrusa]
MDGVSMWKGFMAGKTAGALITSRCFHSHEAFPYAYTIHTPLRNLLLHPPLSTTPDGSLFFFFHFKLFILSFPPPTRPLLLTSRRCGQKSRVPKSNGSADC